MGLTSRLFLAFGVVIALAAAAAVYGMSVVSRTTGDVVQLYDGPLMAVSHARSAQLNFTAGGAAGGGSAGRPRGGGGPGPPAEGGRGPGRGAGGAPAPRAAG